MRKSGKHISGLSFMLVFGLMLMPIPAAAHLVTTGMGPVYDGIGHLLLTPEDLVPVVALGLYAGLRGSLSGRRTLFLLPLSWLVGGLTGLAFDGLTTFPLPLLSFLVVGLLLAADLRLPSSGVALLALGVGLVHGFGNGVVLRAGPGHSGLIGIAVMLFILVALTSALVVSWQKSWQRIVVRVCGSWVFASGLLMGGWFLRGYI